MSVAARASAWLLGPVPAARVAWLRTFLYLFVVADLFLLRPWVADNGSIPGELYQPLFIGRLLPFPTPTELVVAVVRYALIASALVAASGRLVRSAGAVVFVLYVQWMLIAFSYGKVDHDRVAFLVALAVLPTVGRARWDDRTPTEAAGWAVRCVQVAVVATYFLSAFAKFRYGGLDWATGATLMRAVLRRGTWLAEPLEDMPALLGAAQWGILAFELSTPIMLTGGRLARALLVAAIAFHVVTYAAIEILFWPHVMCLLSFVPLERIPVPAWLTRAAPGAPARAAPAPSG